MGKVLLFSGINLSKYAVKQIDADPTKPNPVVPTITLDSTAKTASLSVDKSGLSIYYTTDGSTPTLSSTKYSSAINVSNGANIKAISSNGDEVSAVPSISVSWDNNNGTIALSSSVSGTIRYTTDGTNPTSGSNAYSSEITPTTGETIKVAVFNGSTLVSEIATINIE